MVIEFQGDRLFITYVIGCTVLGYVVGLVLEGEGALAAGGFMVGIWVGWFKTRGPEFSSDAKRREAVSDEQITTMRQEAMRRNPVATIGCVALYFIVFGGGLLLLFYFIWTSSWS